MLKKMIVTLTSQGVLTTEYAGYQGKGCLKAAEELMKELEAFGLDVQINELLMKDTSQVVAVENPATLKVEKK